MIMEKADGKKSASKKESKDDEDDGDFGEAYSSLAKYMQKEYAKQSFWAKGESKA